MGRRPGAPKERHHVHLNPGDWEFLQTKYGSQGLTPSYVIAKLVSTFRRRVEDKITQKLDVSHKLEEIDIDLTIGDDKQP